MRCFIELALAVGFASDPAHIYVNRDLMTVVTPVRMPTGSEYVRARTLISLNGAALRYVVETPDEVMRRPCVVGGGGD